MKKILLFLVLTNTAILAQKHKDFKLGKIQLEELKMTVYEKDSSANAVVLEERVHITANNKYSYSFTKNYYIRIKILKSSAFDLGKIYLFHNKNSRYKNLEAITYNLTNTGKVEKSLLTEKNIFKTKYSKYSSISSFSLPNVKTGSVIEYKFTLTSKGYGIYESEFQSDIPKIKTIYTAYLSGKPEFKVRLIGFLKPDFEEAVIKKKCIGVYRCTAIHYEMYDVPAFETEKFMTNKDNFISRLSFESVYYDPWVKKGKNREWRVLDKNFKETYEHRMDRSSYFRRKLPDYILNEKDLLQRAKMVYRFVLQHYTIDKVSNNNMFKAYEQKTGRASIINLSLYNALKAANIGNVKLLLLSTRKNGYLTKLFASIEDFNYRLIRVVIDGEKYLLDATNKNQPFGFIPFSTLNGEGRVLDFKNGSYWEAVKPSVKSIQKTKIQVSIDNEGLIKAKVKISYTGYFAKDKREKLTLLNKSDYLEELESNQDLDLSIDEYTLANLKSLEKPLKESFTIAIEDDLSEGNLLKINPFFYEQITENPFKLKERLYPVDFGYSKKSTYLLSLKIPANYSVKKIPKNHAFKLPNNGGYFFIKYSQSKNVINIYFKFENKKAQYSPSEYHYLKELYKQLIQSQDASIILERSSN